MNVTSEFKIGQHINAKVVYGGISDEMGTDMFIMDEVHVVSDYGLAQSVVHHYQDSEGRVGCKQALNEFRPGSKLGEQQSHEGRIYHILQDPENDDECWRSPTVKELIQIYKMRDIIGNFKTAYYRNLPEYNDRRPKYLLTSEQVLEQYGDTEWEKDFITHTKAMDFTTGEVTPLYKGEPANVCLVWTKKRQPN